MGTSSHMEPGAREMAEESTPKGHPTAQCHQVKPQLPHNPYPMAPHLSRALYSSSDMASPGNSGASVDPHSGDSW